MFFDLFLIDKCLSQTRTITTIAKRKNRKYIKEIFHFPSKPKKKK